MGQFRVQVGWPTDSNGWCSREKLIFFENTGTWRYYLYTIHVIMYFFHSWDSCLMKLSRGLGISQTQWCQNNYDFVIISFFQLRAQDPNFMEPLREYVLYTDSIKVSHLRYFFFMFMWGISPYIFQFKSMYLFHEIESPWLCTTMYGYVQLMYDSILWNNFVNI